MKRGRFIVFEGMDGAGSSTQTDLTCQYLNSLGIDVFKTKEPTDKNPEPTAVAPLIRAVLQKKFKFDSYGLQLLFSADRADHCRQIESVLTEGKWVVCDRYYYSTFAYGSLNGIENYNLLKSINAPFLKPDIAFYLDLPPEVSVARIDLRGQKVELFENLEKLTKVREGYFQVMRDFYELKPVDGTLSKEEINRYIQKQLEKFL